MGSSATNLVLAAIVLSSCLGFSRCEDPHQNCTTFHCGKYRNLRWPFAQSPSPECYPIFVIGGCDQPSPSIRLGEEYEKRYELMDIDPDDGVLRLQDPSLSSSSNQCEAFNTIIPEAPDIFSWKNPIIPLLRCNRNHASLSLPLLDSHYEKCKDYDIYYNKSQNPPPAFPSQLPPTCTIIRLPLNETLGTAPLPPDDDLSELIATDLYLQNCDICTSFGKKCKQCKGSRREARLKLVIGLGIGLPIVAILLFCAIFYVRRRYRQKSASSGFLPTKTNSDPSWKTDFERDGAYFGVPVFAYSELEEATNCFDPTKELGEGGFGAVYYGQLRDGREVAVKRLYENNCKRVQQFMNEIKILTGLRHKNLVTLYGCTSRHSRELLLVYEFISNGTVADHLHGDRSAPTPLAWPVRLRIAVETANALTYLHASGIIHRDIKTSNILLDNNFCVKVADFGLSRLFPTDVTHVSTAPQGTPGYVDPEYHMCYQLTERSDVYSFGVVLIELISSLPAVDICRDRKEINLANLAVNRIRNREFSEFLDPCLRFESDLEVRRTVLMVADLAYQCLQLDRDQRPSMEEALSILKGIQGDHDNDAQPTGDNRAMMAPQGNVQRAPAWLESEDGVLVKRTHFLTSPVSVTDKWVSGATSTPTRIVTV